jgi:hypothetical protein
MIESVRTAEFYVAATAIRALRLINNSTPPNTYVGKYRIYHLSFQSAFKNDESFVCDQYRQKTIGVLDRIFVNKNYNDNSFWSVVDGTHQLICFFADTNVVIEEVPNNISADLKAFSMSRNQYRKLSSKEMDGHPLFNPTTPKNVISLATKRLEILSA